ncbi:hypothetical protein OCH239_04415 [Roseivivax halodurans JCM 10272]|uniref:Uncharacterized protein n=1 Tax=Roseivivax halodurans JCM 10272 TaxID=1449350 RepID=X7EEH2_9RHOB|nr:hypothetical protein OCH239_04415 [Roseivivax halodurans JCM 10272]
MRLDGLENDEGGTETITGVSADATLRQADHDRNRLQRHQYRHDRRQAGAD